jgi:hypothetical protein
LTTETFTVDGTVNAVQSGTWVIDSITNPVTVTASDLDIRDIDHLTDSIKIGDGVEFLSINPDGSINVVSDDLDAANDSVASWTHDGAGNAITSTVDGGSRGLDVNILNQLEVEDATLADTAILASANSLGAGAAAASVVASALANRKYLHIMNVDNRRVFIGQAGVTEATGYPLSPRAAIMLRAGANVDVQFVGTATSTPDIRVLELS